MSDFMNLTTRTTEQLVKDWHAGQERKTDILAHLDAILHELARRGHYLKTLAVPLEDRSARITITCEGFEQFTREPINPEVQDETH